MRQKCRNIEGEFFTHRSFFTSVHTFYTPTHTHTLCLQTSVSPVEASASAWSIRCFPEECARAVRYEAERGPQNLQLKPLISFTRFPSFAELLPGMCVPVRRRRLPVVLHYLLRRPGGAHVWEQQLLSVRRSGLAFNAQRALKKFAFSAVLNACIRGLNGSWAAFIPLGVIKLSCCGDN